MDLFIRITLRLKGNGMGFIRRIKPKNAFQNHVIEKEDISNENHAVFSFDMLKFEKLEISVVGYFGESSIVIDPLDIKKLDRFTGKELIIAQMSVDELYQQSFLYVLWKEMESLSINNSFKERNAAFDKLMEIQKIFPKIETGMDLKPKFEELLDTLGEGIIGSHINDAKKNELLISYDVKDLKIIRDNFITSCKKEEPTYFLPQALLDFKPFAVGVLHEGICKDIQLGPGIKSIVLFGAGCALVGATLVFPFLTPLVGVALTYSVGGAMLAGTFGVGALGLAYLFKKKMDTKYESFLVSVLESLGKDQTIKEQKELPACIPYILEKEIYDQVSNFIDNDSNAIKKKWTSYFPKGALYYVKETSKQDVLNSIKGVMKNYELRKILSHDLTIGVVGTGNAGKSTLVQKLFGLDTNPGLNQRTESIKPYELQESIHVIDFPHLTSTIQSIRPNFISLCANLDIIIVVLDGTQVLDSNCDAYVVSLFKEIQKSGNCAKWLFCYNSYDRVIQNDHAKRFKEGTINAKRSDEVSYMKSKKEEFLKKCKDASVESFSNVDAFVTSFEFIGKKNPFETAYTNQIYTSENLDHDQKATKLLNEIELKGVEDVKKWIIKQLEHNNIDKIRIEQIDKMKYVPKEPGRIVKIIDE
jgi:GTP-binding protein EngB required for normal cell division